MLDFLGFPYYDYVAGLLIHCATGEPTFFIEARGGGERCMLERIDAAPARGTGPSAGLIMVVDHDANDLFYAAMLLQRFEYRVCSAKTASLALETLSVAQPGLVITAYDRRQSGRPGLLALLKQDPRTSMVPVIVVIAAGDLVAERRSLDAGAARCLAKPLQAEELFQAVQLTIEPFPRAGIRVPASIPVSVDNMPLDYNSGECATDLSEQGMYVRTLKPSPTHAHVSVTIVLKDRPIALDAEVLYSHRIGQGAFGEPGMGLRFTTIPPEGQAFIRRYIHESINRGIMPAQR